MGGLSMYSILVSFIIMGVVLFALSSSFTSIATNYSLPISSNTTGFFNTVNSSQDSILGWANSTQAGITENDPTSNLASWITTGIAFIILSPFTLISVFINLIGAFSNSMAFALGVDVGDMAFLTNAIVAIITLTFLYAIIKGLTGKE